MLSHVTARIELEGFKSTSLPFTSIELCQAFNAHHELTITVPFTAMEQLEAIDIVNTQKLVGKSIVLSIMHVRDSETIQRFRGIFSEVHYTISDNFTRNLVLKCYAPTILLDTGPDYHSFLNKSLTQVVEAMTQPMNADGSMVQVNTSKTPISYLCQYKESAFNFLNRLSADFMQPFYYDGTYLFFGAPKESSRIDLVYGHDLEYLQVAYRVVPLKFSKYNYYWADHSVIRAEAPTALDVAQWNNIGKTLFDESQHLFTHAGQSPAMPVADDVNNITEVAKWEEVRRANKIKTVSGRSVDAQVKIGSVINVKITDTADQGQYLITAVKHYIAESGQYYNIFEGVTTEVPFTPLHHAPMPQVELESAVVKSNADPEGKGRVQVQTHWQAAKGETTDWIKVMTPDGGAGKDGGGNRGLVVIPEEGDTVIIYYSLNDPKRPFVLGSMFTGRTGAGGGQGNKNKSLSVKSGAQISLADTQVKIVDAGGDHITLDGTNKITIDAKAKIELMAPTEIVLKVGGTSVTMNADGITLKGDTVKIEAKTAGVIGTERALLQQNSDTFFQVTGGNAGIKGSEIKALGKKMDLKSDSEMKIDGNSVKVIANAVAEIKGALVNING